MPKMEETLKAFAEQAYPGRRVELVSYADDGTGRLRETDARVLSSPVAEALEADAQEGVEIQVRSYIRI